ncbi:UPF0323 family lipoprotein [Campylobacter hyointestinalis]|uniref:Flagellar motility protein n=1 Tax=Campylobacter hyointestinalis subsp. hyointestinalis TaxID=91352 RepID=A0A2S5JBK9_CAMHY|nr:UPF0323 family lipoprotein [Campylobacter hyointestinalis]PPB56619.1 hypothetical protein CDQ67_00260 [Campylobacter hyointestinalis subsp. hyointestinalis]PPB58163.1 hypothetical protein CDQ71_04475 [Campylobacter hyointestinalis subsp. hyointestinalis]PPB60403.1 hypothetical protein CDQ72_07910 [Campylobacter hyointestinalis subsp. hyointestinalis]PPB61532.1 hypothetical protein CDQ73_07910 [Campylobacter hyointestinalis subsp. hyointestinalis]PPB68468.1 hypothetical protein CDQ76_04940 [
MKHIKTLKDIGKISGLSAILVFGLAACGNESNSSSDGSGAINEAANKQGATVFVEKNSDGSYKIADEFPSNETRVFLREPGENGQVQERLLSAAELDKLMQEENAKIDAGTSNLTNQNASVSSGGMSLGETILASAAGAIIGSWIGSKLFNSPGYQNQRQTAYKNPSAYNKSVNSFNKASTSSSKAASSKSGFFGGGSKAASSGTSVGG